VNQSHNNTHLSMMRKKTDATIDKAQARLNARALIRQFQNSPPVDVKAIAESLGLSVWEIPHLPDTVSGKIFLDPRHGGGSGYSIGVNEREGFNRKRFTIAHEVGHFLLHREFIGDGIIDDAMYRSKLTSRQEIEANRFAADLLMPYNLISAELRRGNRDVAALAKAFKVSEPAMRIRLGIPVA
jgi:hypothetical protein